MASVFGAIITDDQVEEAVLATLRKWIPTYMAEVERQVGLDAGFYETPVASSYTARTDFDNWPEDMLPAIVAIGTGVEDDPAKDGYGHLRGHFMIGISGIVTSTDKLSTRRYAARLGGAIRATLVQHESLDLALGGRVRGVKFVGSRNNELPTEDERTIWANRQLFDVEVGDFLSTAGPEAAQPQPDPTDPWPDPVTVTTPHVLLDHE